MRQAPDDARPAGLMRLDTDTQRALARLFPVPPPRPRPAAEVTVLLALHDGARFIDEQLDSLLGQDHDAWRLIVSDDGSGDRGPRRVTDFAERNPDREIRLIDGPCAGFARNFLHLLAAVDRPGPYTAFCDQDDFWLPGKLARAVQVLAEVPEGVPALYCSRTWICDSTLGHWRLSDAWPRPPSFRNALVQNIAPGNTMVLNRAALRLIQAASRRVTAVPAHDWWAYLLVTGAGGRVLHDDRPGLLYRQHRDNVIGANRGLRAALRRQRIALDGSWRRWHDQNTEALHHAAPYLTPENREVLEAFRRARNLRLRPRMAALQGIGLHRQKPVETACLWLAAALGQL